MIGFSCIISNYILKSLSPSLSLSSSLSLCVSLALLFLFVSLSYLFLCRSLSFSLQTLARLPNKTCIRLRIDEQFVNVQLEKKSNYSDHETASPLLRLI